MTSEEAEAKADGLTVPCVCGHVEWMHPEEAFGPADRFFCGECGNDLGSWAEVHAKLFTAGAMLDAILRQPG